MCPMFQNAPQIMINLQSYMEHTPKGRAIQLSMSARQKEKHLQEWAFTVGAYCPGTLQGFSNSILLWEELLSPFFTPQGILLYTVVMCQHPVTNPVKKKIYWATREKLNYRRKLTVSYITRTKSTINWSRLQEEKKGIRP